VVESIQTPLLVLWSNLRVRTANRAFFHSYGLQPADVENRFLYTVGGDLWNLPGLRTALERLSSGQESVDALEFEQEVSGSGKRMVVINARKVQPDGEHQILVAIEDVTAQRQAESILRKEQERLRRTVQEGAAELARTSESLQTETSDKERAETALHDSEAALLRTREELRALTASLLKAQEEERRRVSRELHDDLSQKMARLQFDVETLEQQLPSDMTDDKTRLQSIRDEVAALSNDLRRIAYELHPSMLDHLGLSVALRAFSREFSEREAIPVKFTARKVPAQISTEVASALYRIAQEALRNVAKHAGKTTVKISLTGGRNVVSLSIQDYGIGFDSLSVQGKGGLGLISMQERARLLHGEFSLEASPGCGVILMIRVPLN
jgi:signal transduction histidine kinase